VSAIDEVIAQIPYARFLDVREDSDESGSLVVLPFCDEIVGNVNLPAVHGGVVGAFLELTALLQLMEQGLERVPRPINFNIDFLRSVGPRDTRGRADPLWQVSPLPAPTFFAT